MCWQCKHIQGESSKDHEYRLVPSSTNRKTESNNNPMVMVPVVGFVRQSNGSDSSLSFIGHVLPEGASSHWLPAIDQTKPEHNQSLVSILLPPIGKSSDESKIHRCLRCRDQRTTNPSAKGWMVRCLHWLPSTGIMSGDSDLYDRNMEVDHDHSKVLEAKNKRRKKKEQQLYYKCFLIELGRDRQRYRSIQGLFHGKCTRINLVHCIISCLVSFQLTTT